MFSLFLEVIDKIDNKLNSLQGQIDSLETRFSTCEKEETKNQIKPVASPPKSAPMIKKEIPVNPRKELMNELRKLLEKRNKNIDESQK